MAGIEMSRKSTFTLWHGFAASVAFHATLGLPFVLYALAEPPEEPPPLVIELQGTVAENQTEQKVQQETKGSAEQEKAETAKPAAAPTAQAADDPPVDDKDASMPPPAPAESKQTPDSPAETKSGSAGPQNISGADERQTAQTIRTERETEIDRLREYVKLLSKKVQANLVYPDAGRQAGLQGTATVSFTILQSGQIRPETLKIVASSGQPKLDASALKTIRASIPFDPAPNEMTVAIAVAFGRKR